MGACRRHWAPTALTIRLGRSVLLGTPAHHQRHVRLMEKMMSKTNDKTRELTEAELSLVSGADKAEAQIFQALSSAISEVMKNFGGALNTAARGG